MNILLLGIKPSALAEGFCRLNIDVFLITLVFKIASVYWEKLGACQ